MLVFIKILEQKISPTYLSVTCVALNAIIHGYFSPNMVEQSTEDHHNLLVLLLDVALHTVGWSKVNATMNVGEDNTHAEA